MTTHHLVDRYSRASGGFLRPISAKGMEAIEQKPLELRRIRSLRTCPYQGGRVGRQRYTSTRYQELMVGQVLDVGCDKAEMRKYVPGSYVGVDLFGNPDVVCDLGMGLPFRDESFDCVVATEVLEHMADLHATFDELLRVSRRYVIISIPNCWHGYLRRMWLGASEQKNYGLPPEPTGDRHRWYFNSEEAENFVYYRAAINGAYVLSCEQFTHPGDIFTIQFGLLGKNFRYPIRDIPSRTGWKRILLSMTEQSLEVIEKTIKRIGWGWGNPYRYKNAFVLSNWFVIEKRTFN